MNPLVVHFVSGDAFFSGMTVIVLAGVLSTCLATRRARPVIFLLAVVGWLFVIVCATPFPMLFYAAWSSVVAVWTIFVASDLARRSKLRIALGVLVATSSLYAVAVELPRRNVPSLPPGRFDVLYVIGDSISAGVGGRGEQTWPRILRQRHGLNVVDLSQPGATTAAAVMQAHRVLQDNAIVVVEIGGNDLLRPTPAREFERDLQRVLAGAARPGNVVLMFELPLFPFQNEYGRVQRNLAAKYDVVLIPRPVFAKILGSPGATVDGLHLSQKGHRLMAELIWNIAGGSINLRAESPDQS